MPLCNSSNGIPLFVHSPLPIRPLMPYPLLSVSLLYRIFFYGCKHPLIIPSSRGRLQTSLHFNHPPLVCRVWDDHL